jgi:hypothetical protein
MLKEFATSLLIWTLSHFFISRFIILNLTKYLYAEKLKGQKITRTSHLKGKALKFAVTAWRVIAFSVSTLSGLYYLSKEDWVFNPIEYLKGWPDAHVLSHNQAMYYTIAFGCVAHYTAMLLVEPKQKDFNAMVYIQI